MIEFENVLFFIELINFMMYIIVVIIMMMVIMMIIIIIVYEKKYNDIKNEMYFLCLFYSFCCF